MSIKVPESIEGFADPIEPEYTDETIQMARANCLWAFSRRTGVLIGPVVDIICCEGEQLVLIDIDQQMTFHAKSKNVLLYELRATQ